MEKQRQSSTNLTGGRKDIRVGQIYNNSSNCSGNINGCK